MLGAVAPLLSSSSFGVFFFALEIISNACMLYDKQEQHSTKWRRRKEREKKKTNKIVAALANHYSHLYEHKHMLSYTMIIIWTNVIIISMNRFLKHIENLKQPYNIDIKLKKWTKKKNNSFQMGLQILRIRRKVKKNE